MLHQSIFFMYFFDIWRRHSHPHSWFLNTPCFFLWLIDLFIGRCWRYHRADLQRFKLSEDYSIVYWRSGKQVEAVGPLVYLKWPGQSLWHRAHAFTSFSNRRCLSLPPKGISNTRWTGHVVRLEETSAQTTQPAEEQPELDDAMERACEQWDTCVVMRTFSGSGSTTARIRDWPDDEPLKLDAWGGFHENELHRILRFGNKSLTLVAGGSGMGYLLDALLQLGDYHAPLLLVFNTRDVPLLQYFCWMVEEIVKSFGGKDARELRRVHVFCVYSGNVGELMNIEKLSIGHVHKGCLDYQKLFQVMPRGLVCTMGSSGFRQMVDRSVKEGGSWSIDHSDLSGLDPVNNFLDAIKKLACAVTSSHRGSRVNSNSSEATTLVSNLFKEFFFDDITTPPA